MDDLEKSLMEDLIDVKQKIIDTQKEIIKNDNMIISNLKQQVGLYKEAFEKIKKQFNIPVEEEEEEG